MISPDRQSVAGRSCCLGGPGIHRRRCLCRAAPLSNALLPTTSRDCALPGWKSPKCLWPVIPRGHAACMPDINRLRAVPTRQRSASSHASSQAEPRFRREPGVRNQGIDGYFDYLTDMNHRDKAIVLVGEIDLHCPVETRSLLVKRHAWARNVVVRDGIPVGTSPADEFLVFGPPRFPTMSQEVECPIV